MSADFRSLLRELTAAICELSEAQVADLEGHYQLLSSWNRKINLTRVIEMEHAIRRHYAESLFLGARLSAGPGRVADVGSGAGFPGFPVAVLRPDWLVTLVESDQRKAVFLREAARGRANIRVVAERAEAVGRDFDWMVSRAVRLAAGTELAPRVALLVGTVEAEQMRMSERYRALEITPLPWGERRVLVIGEVVPRETSVVGCPLGKNNRDRQSKGRRGEDHDRD